MRYLLLAVLLAGCASDDDVTPTQATVLGYLADGGPWMEDYVWGGSYTGCTDCEELSVFDFAEDGYRISLYVRAPGETAADATLDCAGDFGVVETAIDGFDPHERTRLDLTIGDNDCGWTSVGVSQAWIIQAVTHDADGAPSYLAWWPETADPADGPFPGYESDGPGHSADPIRPCATAPDTLCEPSCVLADGGCDLPTPE